MNPVESVKRPTSLREQVATRLREAIVNGRLRPGQKLVERELCELLDISRTLLREALQQLQAEGLIHSALHRGPAVAMIGAEEAGEIYQVREALEALVGAAFARNASDDDIAQLEQTFEVLKTAAEAGDVAAMLMAKNAMYDVLFERCGNRTAAQMLAILNNRLMLFKRLSLGAPGRAKAMMQEVRAIVAVIKARDPERAGDLFKEHVVNARRAVMQELQSGKTLDLAASA